MTNKKLSFLLALLFAVGVVSAGPGDPLIVKSNLNDAGMAVVLANLEGVTTTVKLKSLTSHKVLHTETVRKHNGYTYQFDLSSLERGSYYLEITKGEVVKRQVVVVNEHGVLLSSIK